MLLCCPVVSHALRTGVAMQVRKDIHSESSALPAKLRHWCLLHSRCPRHRSQQHHLLECLSVLGDDFADSLVRLAVCGCQLQVGRALALGGARHAGGSVLWQLLVAAWNSRHRRHRDAPATPWWIRSSHAGALHLQLLTTQLLNLRYERRLHIGGPHTVAVHPMRRALCAMGMHLGSRRDPAQWQR